MSAFTRLDQSVIERGVARLRRDLESGEWERRFEPLAPLDALDLGYRLITTRG